MHVAEQGGHKKILICRCAERGLLADVQAAIGRANGPGLTVCDDLCLAAVREDAVLADIAAADAPEIYACYPRAVRALFAFAGHPLPAQTVFHNLRRAEPAPTTDNNGDQPTAWFPVLDKARCTDCGQCFEFCLFGVYHKAADGTIRVANPDACKNNCPACARLCPAAAIIFPKATEAPIAGAPITDESEREAAIKIDVDAILGDDIYATLNARKQKRQALLNRKRVERALAERSRCAGGHA